ncbi:MAG: hypothetical protein K8F91_13310 [Candidatus Obscuribacterales bacterium]|nr:hypothetical protein [Candidatus Obscuribacterales bacterium]
MIVTSHCPRLERVEKARANLLPPQVKQIVPTKTVVESNYSTAVFAFILNHSQVKHWEINNFVNRICHHRIERKSHSSSGKPPEP